MSEACAPPGTEPPAVLPAAWALAVLASRPVRVAGGQPGSLIVLVEIDVRGTS